MAEGLRLFCQTNQKDEGFKALFFVAKKRKNMKIIDNVQHSPYNIVTIMFYSTMLKSISGSVPRDHLAFIMPFSG